MMFTLAVLSEVSLQRLDGFQQSLAQIFMFSTRDISIALISFCTIFFPVPLLNLYLESDSIVLHDSHL